MEKCCEGCFDEGEQTAQKFPFRRLDFEMVWIENSHMTYVRHRMTLQVFRCKQRKVESGIKIIQV